MFFVTARTLDTNDITKKLITKEVEEILSPIIGEQACIACRHQLPHGIADVLPITSKLVTQVILWLPINNFEKSLQPADTENKQGSFLFFICIFKNMG